MAEVPSASEFKRFLTWVEAKHQHLVCLWKKLDKDGSMSLHKGEFMKGLKELGYNGDLEKLWSHIDTDTTGIISFLEFAPEQALDLARFKQWAHEKFGSFQATFAAMDTDRSGRITMPEFVDACKEQGLPPSLLESAQTLFMLLDNDHGTKLGGTITEDELVFLDKWECPPYLWETPDFGARERFKAALVRRHNGNPLLVWRKVLDKDASMRVSYDEFVITCKTLARMNVPDAPGPSKVPSLFCAFDQDRSGWFSLRNWDDDAYHILRTFLDWARAKSGKVTACVRGITQGDGKFANWAAFRAALKDSGLKNTELPYLFEALCVSKAGQISPADVAFLDKWDPNLEAEEEEAWEQMVAKRLSLDLVRKH